MDTGSDIKLHLPHPSAHGAGAASSSATLTRLNHADEGKRILNEHMRTSGVLITRERADTLT